MKLRIGNRRVSVRFILIIILIIALIGVGVYSAAIKNDHVLKTELVDVTLNGYGFFVWNEAVYPINNDQVASYAKVDGASTEKDELVAEVYQYSSAADIEHEGNGLEIDIYNIQRDSLIEDKDLNNITFTINNHLFDLQKKVVNDHQPQQLGEMISSIHQEYEKRNEYMDIHVEPTNALLKLYDKEADCKIRLTDQTDRIIAPREGRIFFSVDGYEEEFKYNDIDTLKASDGNKAIKPNSEEDDQSYDELLPSFFKIVNEKSCYYVANIETDIVPIKGTKVEIEFPTILVENVQASIYDVEKTETENLWTIKLQIDNPTDELFNNRTSEVYILYRKMGMFIPNKCLMDESKTSVSILSPSVKEYEDVAFNPFLKTTNGYYIKLEDNEKIKISDKIKIY